MVPGPGGDHLQVRPVLSETWTLLSESHGLNYSQGPEVAAKGAGGGYNN